MYYLFPTANTPPCIIQELPFRMISSSGASTGRRKTLSTVCIIIIITNAITSYWYQEAMKKAAYPDTSHFHAGVRRGFRNGTRLCALGNGSVANTQSGNPTYAQESQTWVRSRVGISVPLSLYYFHSWYVYSAGWWEEDYEQTCRYYNHVMGHWEKFRFQPRDGFARK